MKYYQNVVEFVQRSFNTKKEIYPHFERTVYWAAQLKPDADEAIKVAAYAHDIEKAFREKQDTQDEKKKMYNEEEMKRHQSRGAGITAEYLVSLGAENTFVDRVRMLIEKHEVGGNHDQNTLKDADSISFLENNVDIYMDRYLQKLGKKVIHDKLDWTYNRISSEEAKRIAKPMYEDALNKLEDRVN